MAVHIEHPDSLYDFAKSTDRGSSLVFVGRDAELDRLAEFAEQLRSPPPEDRLHEMLDGQTVLFEACPGMGKTALIREFARLAQKQGCLAMNVDIDTLASHAAMKDHIARELDRLTHRRDWVARLAGAALTDAGEALRIGNFVKAAIGAAPEPTGCWPDGTPRPPLVLIIDEAQDLGPEHKPAVRSLHLGNLNWPILPVFAGTSGALRAMKKAGAYRLGEGRNEPFGSLPKNEARLAFPAMCDRFGIGMSPREMDRWTARIATGSHGFPQHLNVGLKSAAEEILAANGQGRAPSLERMAEQFSKRRDGYYRDRLGVLPHHGSALVAAVKAIRQYPAGNAHRNAVEAAFLSASNKDREAEGLPPLQAGEEARLINRAIENGVFQPSAAGSLELSIPSMGDYIVHTFGERERERERENET